MKSWKLLAVIGAALVTAQTQAASLDKEVAKCATNHKGELDRLECYDNLARERGLMGPQAQPTDIKGKGDWRVSVDTNPIDDSTTVTLVLPSESGKSRWGRPINLVARCKSNTTELYINWNDYLGSEAKVTTRVGDMAANTKNWSLSTDSQATFYPRGDIGFLKEMMRADRLVAQVTPYNENPVTAIFDTAGMENAIEPLRTTCNW